MPFTQNNPFPRKTSPLRVDPFAKKVKTIAPGIVSIDNPEAEDVTMNQKPIKLEGQPMPEKPYEELSDMEEAGVEQPDYEDLDRKPLDNTVQGRY
tara:strand:+ start:1327 stop:1611 length:285 start_codon:yes stop_codon:yes gene_type:complete